MTVLTSRKGYRMAQNLRAKLPSSDTLIVHDVNAEAASRLAKESSGVEVAEDVRSLAERAVRSSPLSKSPETNHPHHARRSN
jgi:hypothetical protein